MAEILKERKVWQQPLTVEAFLAVAEHAWALTEPKSGTSNDAAERHRRHAWAFHAHVEMRDERSSLEAESVDELASDLGQVNEGMIAHMTLTVQFADQVEVTLGADSALPAIRGNSLLAVEGRDRSRVFVMFGELERLMTRHFALVEDAKTSPGAQAEAIGLASGVRQIREPETDDSAWWNSRWAVAIGGGALAALIAGAVLALLHVH